MNRLFRFFMWTICGCVLLLCALLIPAHFRAVDGRIIERAGVGTPSLIQQALSFLNVEKLGPARLLAVAAQLLNVHGHEQLSVTIAQALRLHPKLAAFGGPDPIIEKLGDVVATPLERRPIIEILLQGPFRERLIDSLQASRRPGVQEILNNRALTNTVQFASATSPSGQPFAAVISLTALLAQEDHFTPALREKIEFLAHHANHGGSVDSLETVYLDLLSLGQRLDLAQLAQFLYRIEDTITLHELTETIRIRNENLPIVYSAVVFSGQPQKVASYLNKFSQTGVSDLGLSLRSGKGGLDELLRRQHRVYSSGWQRTLIAYDPFGTFFYAAVPFCYRAPVAAIILRCALLIFAGFCL